MTPEELEAIKARHHSYPEAPTDPSRELYWGACDHCFTRSGASVSWPCDAALLLARIEELEKEMRAAATVVGAAAALERCPECDIKALDCGHAEELHDALAALGGEDG